MPAATTAIAAANEFLKLARAEGLAIDQMKLQKLLYYAQAWRLGIHDEPLFEEPIEAWPWGPVVRKVYNETRDRGRKPIVEPLRDVVKVSDDPLDYRFDAPDGVDGPETAEFIRSVWDTHKRYTGIQLSNATHAKGEPWTVIKDRVGHLNQKPVIPDDLIGRIFKRKLDDAAETAPSAAR